MINPVHQLLLARLDATPAPTLSLREISIHAEPLWRPLITAGVLAEADTPEEIEVTRRTLAVKKIGDAYYGFDTSEEFPTPQRLDRDDLTTFRVVVPRLVAYLRTATAIDGRTSNAAPAAALHFIGRKSMSGGVVSVWIAVALGSPDAAAGCLATLSQDDSHTQHVVVFPIWPELPAATISSLTATGVFVADLDPASLAIRWPQELVGIAAPKVPDYGLICEGASWRIHFLGDELTIKSRTGVIHLARLLNDPTASWTPLEIQAGRRTTPLHQLPAHPEDGTEISETMEMPLPAASGSDLARLRRTLAPLRLQLAEAIRTGDTASEREARADIAKFLPSSTQISGRDNRPRVTGAAEKARKNVSKQINAVLDIIEDERPTIGRHLREHLTLGQSMTYSPPRGEVWKVVFPKN